jgi:hypothetical protein
MTDELGEAWPAAYKRVLPDHDPGESRHGQRWYVRSPWPSLGLDRVLDIVIANVDDSGGAEVQTARAAEVLKWPESRARNA